MLDRNRVGPQIIGDVGRRAAVIAVAVLLSSCSSLAPQSATPGVATPIATVVPSPFELMTPLPGGPDVALAGFVTSTVGWAVWDRRLHWTSTAGASWRDVTPSELTDSEIAAVAFADPSTGWLLTSDVPQSGSSAVRVFGTVDGGATWSRSDLPYTTADPVGTSGVAIDVVDRTDVWIVIRHPGSAATDAGELFGSSDGGATWVSREIPIGDPVRFFKKDITTGFVSGGVAGDQLYKTSDGAVSWVRETLPPIFGGEQIHTGLPTFFSESEGILPITILEEQSVVVFLTTGDGGNTWTGAGQVNVQISTIEASTAIRSMSDWVVAAGSIFQTIDGGLSWTEERPRLAVGSILTSVQFVDKEHAWALAPISVCLSGKENCQARTALLSTADGGLTWVELRS
jgi:photosystem II stability/assembly factor-like uncharacterized protein